MYIDCVSKEHVVVPTVAENLPPVSFDISMGEMARAKGFTYDIDYQEVYAAMLAGSYSTLLQTVGSDNLIAFPLAAIAGDMTLCFALSVEYVSRQQEERAFGVEDSVSSQNVVVVENGEINPKPHMSIKRVLKDIFVPDFKL